MVANSLVCIVAQRLMRKVCPECAKEGELTEYEQRLLDETTGTIMRPQGCKKVFGSKTGTGRLFVIKLEQ